MKSKIIDEDYLRWEETRQYDKVVAECIEYVYQIACANDNVLVLNFDEPDSYDSKFLFKIARLCNTAVTIPIYLRMKRKEYKKFLKENKTEYSVKRMRKNNKYIELSEGYLRDLIIPMNKKYCPDDIFERIYKEFWEVEEEFLDEEETNFNNTMTAIGEEKDV